MTSTTWDQSYGLERTPATAAVKLAMPAVLLLIAFTMPPETSVSLGAVRLSPFRVVLLITVMPSLIHLLSGKAGPLNAIDIAMLLHSFWCIIAFAAYGGIGQAIESGGIYFVECFGAYAMGRRYIRNAADFQAMSLFVALIVCCLLLLAIPESLSHVPYIRDTFRSILGGPTLEFIEPRLGLSRAYGPFDHPILFGVFCSMAFGTAWYVVRPRLSPVRAYTIIFAVMLASFLSLSAGAWTMVVMQIALIGWDRVTKGLPMRWGMLFAGIVLILVAVSMLSNRSPVKVFISYASFSAQSSYNRVLIWEFGTAEVARHPLFGIGLGEWTRPIWMSSSMDNFWLIIAVRYGLPALIFLAFAIFYIAIKASARTGMPQDWVNCRMAWIVTVAGAAFAACTVHLWNSTFGFFIFFIGAGAWLVDKQPARPSVAHGGYDDDGQYDDINDYEYTYPEGEDLHDHRQIS